MATGASFSLPHEVDNKCDAVTEAGAEVHGMVKSCMAAAGDALMTVPLKFMKVVKKINEYTAPPRRSRTS
jgi:hypothetical protein